MTDPTLDEVGFRHFVAARLVLECALFVLIYLRWTDRIDWSWWIVLAPIWSPFVSIVFATLLRRKR